MMNPDPLAKVYIKEYDKELADAYVSAGYLKVINVGDHKQDELLYVAGEKANAIPQSCWPDSLKYLHGIRLVYSRQDYEWQLAKDCLPILPTVSTAELVALIRHKDFKKHINNLFYDNQTKTWVGARPAEDCIVDIDGSGTFVNVKDTQEKKYSNLTSKLDAWRMLVDYVYPEFCPGYWQDSTFKQYVEDTFKHAKEELPTYRIDETSVVKILQAESKHPHKATLTWIAKKEENERVALANILYLLKPSDEAQEDKQKEVIEALVQMLQNQQGQGGPGKKADVDSFKGRGYVDEGLKRGE